MSVSRSGACLKVIQMGAAMFCAMALAHRERERERENVDSAVKGLLACVCVPGPQPFLLLLLRLEGSGPAVRQERARCGGWRRTAGLSHTVRRDCLSLCRPMMVRVTPSH